VVSCVTAITALEVVVVNLFDYGVEVRLSHLHLGVLIVESLSSYALEVNSIANVLRLDRLTAAVYTAAGTTHDLNEGPIALALCDLIHNNLCVSCAGSNGNLDFKACNVVGSFLDTLGTTNLVELNLGVILAGEPALEKTIRSYIPRASSRIACAYELQGLSPQEVVQYICEMADWDEDASAEIVRRGTNKHNGCFRLLNRTCRNISRITNEGERITLDKVREASALMLL